MRPAGGSARAIPGADLDTAWRPTAEAERRKPSEAEEVLRAPPA